MLRRALILGGLCVVVAAVGSVGWAMTSANEKFVACAKKKGGAMRLVDAAKDCRKTERVVTWNQQGPRGLPGPRGIAGENGEDGLDGEDGVDGDDGEDGFDGDDGTNATVKWRYVVTAPISVTGTMVVSSTACPPELPIAVNGGYQPPFGSSISVTASAPVMTGSTPTQWQVRLANGGAPADVVVWVLCSNGTVG